MMMHLVFSLVVVANCFIQSSAWLQPTTTKTTRLASRPCRLLLRSTEDENAWLLPKSKTPRQKVLLWPQRDRVYSTWVAASFVLLFLTVWSSVSLALPGVNALLSEDKKMNWAQVSLDAVFGKCVTLRAPHRQVLSTQSPLLSDMALDVGRHEGQEYRLLSYAWAHGSLFHAAWDAYVLRRALFTQTERLRLREPQPLCEGLFYIATVGAMAAGVAHREFSDAVRAVGMAGVAAAIYGAEFVALRRIGELRTKRTAFVNLIIVSTGGAVFGTSPAPLALGGFVAGAAFAYLTSPTFETVEAEYALLRDKKEASKKKGKSRTFAPRVLAESLKRKPPVMSPRLAFFLLFAFVPQIHQAFLQIPQAIYLAVSRPGALSARTLSVPPLGFFEKLYWKPE